MPIADLVAYIYKNGTVTIPVGRYLWTSGEKKHMKE